MKFRQHRGTIDASMATLREFHTRADFAIHLCEAFPWLLPSGKSIMVEKYDAAPDPRIGWPATFVVTAEGGGVLGFTDGPTPEAGVMD